MEGESIDLGIQSDSDLENQRVCAEEKLNKALQIIEDANGITSDANDLIAKNQRIVAEEQEKLSEIERMQNGGGIESNILGLSRQAWWVILAIGVGVYALKKYRK